MCSARSSLLIKLDELEMSHTQSTPRSLWTVSDEYFWWGNSCISICVRLRNPFRGLIVECIIFPAASETSKPPKTASSRLHLLWPPSSSSSNRGRAQPLPSAFTMFYAHYPHQKISTTLAVRRRCVTSIRYFIVSCSIGCLCL